MTLRKLRQVEPASSIPEIGARQYDRDCVQDIDQNMQVLAILLEAVNVFSYNNRSRDDFNFNLDNKYPKKGPFEFMLPSGFDPHGPVLQLARAGIIDCGFESVVSIDSTKPLSSNAATARASEWLGGLRKNLAGGPGMVIMVERFEDADNTRLQRLHAGMGQLTVPSMYVITMATREPTTYESIPLDAEVAD